MFGNNNKKETQKEVKEVSNTNTIGKGTVVRGDIETFGNIRIEGKLIGTVKTKAKIAMGQPSIIEGNILAQSAEIAGKVIGKVQVSDLLILKPTAVINGDILTNKLQVEPGATINGECKMGVNIKEIKLETSENNLKTNVPFGKAAAGQK